MRLPPEKVFNDAQEDVPRTQPITAIVHGNRRLEPDWRTPVWGR